MNYVEAVMPSRYAIGAHFEAFIRRLVDSGRYGNTSEVIREALQLLEDHEKLREIRLADLDASIEQGLADIEAGRVVDADQVFAELHKMIAERENRQDAAE
jgi:antitoxin ParD1/3/4